MNATLEQVAIREIEIVSLTDCMRNFKTEGWEMRDYLLFNKAHTGEQK